MKKERLLIISDLWGAQKSDWLKYYNRHLSSKFDLLYYDACSLGELDLSVYEQEALHYQFVNGGIEKAVQNLIKLEPDPVNVLAFSIGGTIAWKFGLETANLKQLICVSSTRLRKEVASPQGHILLYFGEEDQFKPTKDWYKEKAVTYELLAAKNHKLYMEATFAEQLSHQILATF